MEALAAMAFVASILLAIVFVFYRREPILGLQSTVTPRGDWTPSADQLRFYNEIEAVDPVTASIAFPRPPRTYEDRHEQRERWKARRDAGSTYNGRPQSRNQRRAVLAQRRHVRRVSLSWLYQFEAQPANKTVRLHLV